MIKYIIEYNHVTRHVNTLYGNKFGDANAIEWEKVNSTFETDDLQKALKEYKSALVDVEIDYEIACGAGYLVIIRGITMYAYDTETEEYISIKNSNNYLNTIFRETELEELRDKCKNILDNIQDKLNDIYDAQDEANELADSLLEEIYD